MYLRMLFFYNDVSFSQFIKPYLLWLLLSLGEISFQVLRRDRFASLTDSAARVTFISLLQFLEMPIGMIPTASCKWNGNGNANDNGTSFIMQNERKACRILVGNFKNPPQGEARTPAIFLPTIISIIIFNVNKEFRLR